MNLKKYALAILLLLLPSIALAGQASSTITNTATVTADNGFTTTGDNTTTVTTAVAPALAQVPTLSSVGLAALTLLLATLGIVTVRRRSRRSA